MNSFALPRRRKGFGLLEVILVFAIVIGASAVVFDVFLPAQQAAAADHDRTMANTLASNALQLYAAGSSVNGPEVMTSFNQYPQQFAPGFCSIDPASGIGDCMSALAGAPISNVMQVNQTEGGATTLLAVGVQFQDLTVSECQALLAGGTVTGGMSGVESDAIATTTPLADESAVINFCTTAAGGSNTIDSVYLMYQPGAVASTSPSATPPSTGPVIPPGSLPPLPPGWTPPWDN